MKSGKGGQGIFHAAHQWVVSCMYASMTTFLTHTVAHSTKPSFMPDINNLNFLKGLVVGFGPKGRFGRMSNSVR